MSIYFRKSTTNYADLPLLIFDVCSATWISPHGGARVPLQLKREAMPWRKLRVARVRESELSCVSGFALPRRVGKHAAAAATALGTFRRQPGVRSAP